MPAQSMLEKSRLLMTLDADDYAAATATGAGVAVADFRKAEVQVNYGSFDSAATADIHMEYSDDDEVTWADLSGDDDVTQVEFAQAIFGTDEDTIQRGLIYVTELPLGTTHLRGIAVVGVGNVRLSVGIRLSEPYKAPVVKDSVAANLGGNAFYAIHGVGAR